jgi:hypothetical protein
MTERKRSGKRAGRPSKSGAKQAHLVIPGAGNGGTIPPPEHRWKAGDPSPNPKGRPRKNAEFRELIMDVMGEVITPDMPNVSRIMAAIRVGLMKNPTPFLEYAFGKVPQAVAQMTWREYLEQQGQDAATAFNRLVEAAAAAKHAATGAGGTGSAGSVEGSGEGSADSAANDRN